MSTLTLFGHPIEAPPDEWEDDTTYTFVLRASGQPSAPAVGLPFLLHGLPAGGGTGGGGALHPNLTVRREAVRGRTLDVFVLDQQRTLRERMPIARLVRDGRATVAGRPAREQEVHVTLEHPLPQVVQWHAWVERDEHFVHFCATTSRERQAQDMPRLRGLADAWR